MNAGLVKGEGFAVDAIIMEVDASRYHGKAPDDIDWSAPERQTRAVAEFLSGLDHQNSNLNYMIDVEEALRVMTQGNIAEVAHGI
jgi:hypothetical protein